jgi:hypothetical protein
MTQSHNVLEAARLLIAMLTETADDVIIEVHLREIGRKIEMVDRMLLEQRDEVSA